jgi:hypothetical protein
VKLNEVLEAQQQKRSDENFSHIAAGSAYARSNDQIAARGLHPRRFSEYSDRV